MLILAILVQGPMVARQRTVPIAPALPPGIAAGTAPRTRRGWRERVRRNLEYRGVRGGGRRALGQRTPVGRGRTAALCLVEDRRRPASRALLPAACVAVLVGVRASCAPGGATR